MSDFKKEVEARIDAISKNNALRSSAAAFVSESIVPKYCYNFSWMGRPIIQYPQDIVALQEIIWSTKPDLIIETGIAHGGSLIMSASMLTLIDCCSAIELGTAFEPKACKSMVLGLDIDIRSHNKAAIEAHPMAHKIKMIQGSSIDKSVIAQVIDYAKGFEKVLVILDSNHTHDHVLQELEAYAPLTSKGSYCIVFDTIVEDVANDMYPDRPWGKGDNPKTAVWEYLKRLESAGRTAADGDRLSFAIDKTIENKLLITVAPDGYLKRV